MSDVEDYLEVNKIATEFERAIAYAIESAKTGNNNGVLNGLAAARRALNEIKKYTSEKHIDWTKPIVNSMTYKLNKVSTEIYVYQELQEAMADALTKGDKERLERLNRNFENFKFEFLS